MQKQIEEFVLYLNERNLSPNTVKVYGDNLQEFLRFTGKKKSVKNIGRKDIKTFLFSLSKKNNQPITRRGKLITLRNFFKYLEDEGMIKNNPVKNVLLPKVPVKEPQFLSEQDIQKLLKTVTAEKKREEVILRILVETGFRLSELTSLDTGDIDIESETVRVRRKGNVERIIPINTGLAKCLGDYIQGRNCLEPLIANARGGRMTQRRVAISVKICFEKAGIARPGISVHSLRHSFCVRLLQKKVNIKVIQTLCNHASLATTERYLHIGNQELKEGMKMAEVL